MDEIIHKWRGMVVFCVDLSMMVVAWLIASWYSSASLFAFLTALHFLPYILLIQAAGFYVCGLYRGVWRFASIPDLIRILKAVTFGSFGVFVSFHFFWKWSLVLPKSLPVVYSVLLILFLAGPRILFRWIMDYTRFFRGGLRVLIVGAGSAAEGIARDLRRLPQHRYYPVAFVDDNNTLLGREVHGVRVMGTCQDIPKFVNQLRIQLILIAIPSASSSDMRRIVGFCARAKVPFRTLPGLQELTEGKGSINTIRQVSLEDLLGREQVEVDWKKISLSIANKIILISGGGGSIGSELCMQVAALSPASLIIVEQSEYSLYAIEMRLHKQFPSLHVQGILNSVTDRDAMDKLFLTYTPDLVFHVAAYKHVPLLEPQVRAAVYNNIMGTRVLAETACKYNLNKFILISTDKAVNPTSVMGVTKRVSEIFCQNLNYYTQTQFITVRFGNVLESSGSVIPLFRKQLEEGEPLTVTHPEVTRFFMTILEATRLIMQTATMGEGGEIFVLDMGEPIKIRYLAEQLISLSGKTLGKDCEIEYTGLRPGEKLYEELFYQGEELNTTDHPKIHKAKAQRFEWSLLLDLMDQLERSYLQQDENALLALLHHIVPEYKPRYKVQYTSNRLQLVNV